MELAAKWLAKPARQPVARPALRSFAAPFRYFAVFLMSAQKPSIPRGTRDFGPAVVARRNYIFGVIRRVFEKFGYAPLETPTLENLSVLTGKYGDEGDQLLFKVLNSGDFAQDVTPEDLDDEQRSKKKFYPKSPKRGCATTSPCPSPATW